MNIYSVVVHCAKISISEIILAFLSQAHSFLFQRLMLKGKRVLKEKAHR